MELYCILNGQSIPMRSFSLSIPQSEIPSFDVTIPTMAIAGFAPYLSDIEVRRAGDSIISGIVKTVRAYPDIPSDGGYGLTTKLRCDSELGRLICEAGADLHFQDTLVSAALTQLLATTALSTWVLGDVSTLQDVQITIDPRDSETLWAQIISVTEESEFDTFVRYGGFVGGQHRLDVGSFNTRDTAQYAILGDNVISAPRFQEPTTEPIKILYPVSGESSDTPVVLDDALNIDPTLSNPAQDYQILVGTGSIINNVIGAGCIKKQDFDIHKTENDAPPTQSELDETAISLYRRAKFEMQASEPHLSLTVKYAHPIPPVIHNAMYFKGQIYEDDYDPITEASTLIPSLQVEGWFRVVNISGSFRERMVEFDPITEMEIPNEVWEVEITDGIVQHEYNSSVVIYKKLKRYNKFDRAGSAVGVVGTTTATLNHNTVPADCAYGGVPLTGKSFTFAPPTPPPTATGVIIQISSVTPPTHLYEITQNGDLVTALILCVSGPAGVPWGVLDNCTIVVSYIYLA